MTLITAAFAKASQVRAEILGMDALPIVVLPHPLASRKAAEAKSIAASLMDAIAAGLVQS